MPNDLPGATPLGRHNPRLAELRRITRGEIPGLTVVDGPKLVHDLAGAGVPILEVFVTPSHLESVLASLGLGDRDSTVRVFVIDESTAARIAPSQHGQGALAVVARPSRAVQPAGVVLYLDHVQDPGNVGGAIRSAAALGASGVACSPGCADPFSPRAVRAAAGQSLLLPVAADVPFADLAGSFLAVGGQVVGTCAHGGRPLADWAPRVPLLLALGSEGQGLTPEIAARCDLAVSIPLAHGVESLNVTVSAALLLAFLGGLVPSPILESSGGGWDDPSS